MRVWDLPVDGLCRNHLLAEHRELHAIWSVIVNRKKGYSRHPEVLRWHGKLGALYLRHEAQKAEMLRRGYSHRSPLDRSQIPRRHGGWVQRTLVDPVSVQARKIRDKRCECDLG